jgi:excisionase family DNA binding protein
MAHVAANYDVLTLDEAAEFLRISPEVAEQLASRGAIPGRRIGEEWRFLRHSIEEWLRRPDYKKTLLAQAGSWREDETLADMLKAIYAARETVES